MLAWHFNVWWTWIWVWVVFHTELIVDRFGKKFIIDIETQAHPSPANWLLIYSGRLVNGKVAEEMGIVNHCVAQNEAGDAAYQRALLLAQEIVPNVSSTIFFYKPQKT